MKSIFRVGERVWVSPQLTGKPDWVEATVTQIDNNPFIGVVINVKTDIGELFFEKEDMFKPLEALELCTL
ncbi:transcriptional regulator [Capnocytophaga leadbetteri]|uniref:transcriptional regulator n=1 Tax=Capnocytophaga leadbetteri TaxID=327575 RepID=UPI0026EBF2DF|nr:transcriptional regulator [Capnocytophaga leadbetteri]